MDKVDKPAISRIFDQSRPVLGLFAKQPVPGAVKTRLTPPLTAEQACGLYRTALAETLSLFCALDLTVVVCFAGQRAWFAETFPGLPLLPQVEGDLGARLQAATRELFPPGGGPLLFAGADSPDLPLSLVRQAVTALQDNAATIIPCVDGGYALIGQKLPAPGLFANIPWSTPQVLPATRARARSLGLSLYETACWEDLDDIASLRRLVARSPDSRTARRALNELGDFLQTEERAN